LFETNSFSGKSINITSMRILISEAGKIAPPHVINEDKDEVG